MTLREFTEKYAPLPEAWEKDHDPIWRKVFPTNLRWRVLENDHYERTGWFTNQYIPATKVLEEEWERIHAGEVIDKEWRKVRVY